MVDMNALDLNKRVFGSLVAAAVGDAMGASTEQMCYEEIVGRFGGPVKTFVAPPEDSMFAAGRPAGRITDDASQLLCMVDAEIEAKGNLTLELVVKHLLRWAEWDEFYERFAGPTTRACIEQLRSGADPLEVGRTGRSSSQGTSNGAAMKAPAAGLAHPGDVERAIDDAVMMCLPTHATQLGISGACAIAAGVAAALGNEANVDRVVDAAFHGARRGEEIGRRIGRVVAGPSVMRRLEMAVGIGRKISEVELARQELLDIIGSGVHISEAAPTAVGLFVAAHGDPWQCIIGGVNMGGDTDTIATIAGSLGGALLGPDTIPTSLIAELNRSNDLGLDERVELLIRLADGDNQGSAEK